MRAAAIAAYLAESKALALIGVYIGVKQAFQVLIQPLMGVIIDRYRKKDVMTLSTLASCLANIAILPLLKSDHALAVYVVVALSVLASVFNSAFSTGVMSSVPKVFEPNQRPIVNSIFGSISTLALTLGPAISGLILGIGGVFSVFMIDTLIFAINFGLLVNLALEKDEAGEKEISYNGSKESFFQQFFQGLKYVKSQKHLIGIVLLGVVSYAGVGATWILNPAFAAKANLSSAHVGYVMSSIGIGSFIGMTVGGLVKQQYFYRMCVSGVLLFVISISFFGNQYTDNIGLSIYLPGLLMGFFACVHEASYWSILQNTVPGNLSGRVFATVDSVTLLGMVLGTQIVDYFLNKFDFSTGVIAVSVFMSLGWIIGSVLLRDASKRTA